MLARYPIVVQDYEIRNGWIVRRAIITPVLHKEFSPEPFRTIWTKARQILSECNRLVIIGYSFPPTDFHTRRLLRESFEHNRLQDLCAVNPDSSTVALVKELTRFNNPVTVASNLDEYLELFDWTPQDVQLREALRARNQA